MRDKIEELVSNLIRDGIESYLGKYEQSDIEKEYTDKFMHLIEEYKIESLNKIIKLCSDLAQSINKDMKVLSEEEKTCAGCKHCIYAPHEIEHPKGFVINLWRCEIFNLNVSVDWRDRMRCNTHWEKA
jgi:hypothetical protein